MEVHLSTTGRRLATLALSLTLLAGTASVVVAKPPAQNAVTIHAAAITYGSAASISGQVTGPNSAGVQVTLEDNPYPYTAGFKPTQLKATTDATGRYTLAPTPTVSTHYRVTAKTKPQSTSPEAAVPVRVKVELRLGDATPSAGQRVRFSGSATPAHDGKVVRIQRRRHGGGWKTVAKTTLVPGTPVGTVSTSMFSKRVRVKRTGTYRARLNPGDGDHATGTSARRRARVG
ncbi:MAG: hypothetical protein QOF76_1319 [Solirubrobacteraceae bacterium]|jgi:hypothetical protein|nr:hypothetical protein [Solirubrobacteraceae bacterium]